MGVSIWGVVKWRGSNAGWSVGGVKFLGSQVERSIEGSQIGGVFGGQLMGYCQFL